MERLRKIYTPYAVDRVIEQFKATTTSYSIIEDGNQLITATNTGRYTANLDLTSCSCTFFNNFGLPCRHLLFLSDRAEILLPVEDFNRRRRMSDDEDEDSQDEHPEAWSPVVIQQRRNRDRVT
ncbi:hypothetical protein OUZ56_024084 [Daphnia magna]|uniref:SWIM-type domain-containing protein n=1 Tax=Daphnia magna TaxID=35525 RepID=A0ABR0B051_9CRUS|nr:hypothetical protein OUZ56_024084 [Daphnia magna]